MEHERRSYGQYCGLAGALDVIGERWTLLIIRELLIGPCRYNELLANLPGIGTNLLAARLKYLAKDGLIEVVPPDQNSKIKRYRLTDEGEALREPVLGMARWGLGRLDAPEVEEAVRPRWAMLAVEAMIDERRAADLDESYEFDIDGEVFHVEARYGKVKVIPGPANQPVLTAQTDARTFVDIGAGRMDPLEATLTKRLVMEGDIEAILRCCRLLGLAPG
ncbi:MAG: transcriptional regulator [Streptosporangiaceae bacterium]|nr:transcriptional regulator [Streptosporangiaceae bacterium]